MKKEISYGVVLFRTREKREVLLIQQQNGDWGFPKVHPEAGESDMETLKRELAEDTGITELQIDMDVPSLRMAYQFENHEGVEVDKTVVLYVGYSTEEPRVLIPQEIREVGWYDIDEARHIITHSESRNLFQTILDI
jgi:ADP-ribose pyrophosphatase YjhB (NUDIX family)